MARKVLKELGKMARDEGNGRKLPDEEATKDIVKGLFEKVS